MILLWCIETLEARTSVLIWHRSANKLAQGVTESEVMEEVVGFASSTSVGASLAHSRPGTGFLTRAAYDYQANYFIAHPQCQPQPVSQPEAGPSTSVADEGTVGEGGTSSGDETVSDR